MKKLSYLLLLAGSFLVITQKSIAQNKIIDSRAAASSKAYTVLNAGSDIVIYKYQHRQHSPKEAEKYAPKYYFTTASSDVLQPLTLTNLKNAYPNNHAFHDALDANFKEDKDLISYDEFHKIYKVNRLLQNK